LQKKGRRVINTETLAKMRAGMSLYLLNIRHYLLVAACRS